MIRLVASQRSMFSAFSFDVFENSASVGMFTWPMVARATNARLPLAKDPLAATLQMDLYGRKYAAPFAYLRRGWTVDVGFDLVALDDPEHLICSAKALAIKRGVQVVVSTLDAGSPLGFFIPPVSLGLKAEIFRGSHGVGCIEAPRGLKLKKSLSLELDADVGRDVAAFALLMALNVLNR